MENQFQKWLISQGYYRRKGSKVWYKDEQVVSGIELHNKLEEYQSTLNIVPTAQKSRWDGRKGKVVGNHPHEGSIAICQGYDYVMGKHALLFKKENGQSFYIFSPANIIWID